MMYNFRHYPGDNDGTPSYSEYERDTYYFIHTLQALQHWNAQTQNGEMERPVIPEADNPNPASREVKDFFDHHYQPKKPLEAERFDEAATLLEAIVSTHGIEGLYSFFRVLSSEHDDSGKQMGDQARFKSIVTDVFAPHFAPHPTSEILHGLATLGHVAVAPITGIIAGAVHAPVAAYSAMRFKSLRKERLQRRDEPGLDVIDNLLPLLASMHVIAEHSIEVLNVIEPIQGRPFPTLPPINIKMLETALENTRNSSETVDAENRSLR